MAESFKENRKMVTESILLWATVITAFSISAVMIGVPLLLLSVFWFVETRREDKEFE